MKEFLDAIWCRAGDHGLGFVVVAAEIRRLSTQSSELVNESSRLVDTTRAKVSLGAKNVENTSAALDRITQVIEEASHEMASIKTASDIQIEEIQKILVELGEVDRRIGNTAESAGETSQISAFLIEQAARLEQTLTYFKINDLVVGRADPNRLIALTR